MVFLAEVGLLPFPFPMFVGSFIALTFDVAASSYIAIPLDFSWPGVILSAAFHLVMFAKSQREVRETFDKSIGDQLLVSFTESFVNLGLVH